MTPAASALFVLAVLAIAKTMAGLYFDGHYVCPSCGTRREDMHSDECHWKR